MPEEKKISAAPYGTALKLGAVAPLAGTALEGVGHFLVGPARAPHSDDDARYDQPGKDIDTKHS